MSFSEVATKRLKVALFGGYGRMGSLVSQAIENSPDVDLIARLSHRDSPDLALGAEVIVDFTHPDSVLGNIKWALDNGKNLVVGTTGFDETRLSIVRDWVEATTPKRGAFIISNFSVSAALVTKFAAAAAPYFDSVEIIDFAHNHKAEAPSGTSIDTARAIAAARVKAGVSSSADATMIATPGARGASISGVAIHSLRLVGLVSHQEVLLGSIGELLSLRFDTLDRSAYMAGVLLAIRAVSGRPGLNLELESLLYNLT
jgi:4-hydroxy-tetrahydrodipicolinate reductase